MAINTLVRINHAGTAGDTERKLVGANQMSAGLKLEDFVKSVTSGMIQGKVEIGVNAVKASGTITLSSHASADTVTVHTVTLTADTDYNIGGSDAATATNLAAAINADTTLDGMVVATAADAVVTVTALVPGELGNAVALAISAHGSVSAAYLAGGTNGSVESTHYYGSQTEE